MWECSNAILMLLFQRAFLGFGFIVSNSRGGVIVAKNGRLDGPSKALVAESLGCREALRWIRRPGLENIIIESDSQMLVSAFRKIGSYNSSVGL